MEITRTKKCETCEYWGGTSMNVGSGGFRSQMGCRRHAPSGSGQDSWTWPPTDADDWCGDWERLVVESEKSLIS